MLIFIACLGQQFFPRVFGNLISSVINGKIEKWVVEKVVSANCEKNYSNSLLGLCWNVIINVEKYNRRITLCIIVTEIYQNEISKLHTNGMRLYEITDWVYWWFQWIFMNFEIICQRNCLILKSIIFDNNNLMLKSFFCTNLERQD